MLSTHSGEEKDGDDGDDGGVPQKLEKMSRTRLFEFIILYLMKEYHLFTAEMGDCWDDDTNFSIHFKKIFVVFYDGKFRRLTSIVFSCLIKKHKFCQFIESKILDMDIVLTVYRDVIEHLMNVQFRKIVGLPSIDCPRSNMSNTGFYIAVYDEKKSHFRIYLSFECVNEHFQKHPQHRGYIFHDLQPKDVMNIFTKSVFGENIPPLPRSIIGIIFDYDEYKTHVLFCSKHPLVS